MLRLYQLAIDDARARLREAVKEARASGQPRLIRIESYLPDTDPLIWLQNQQHPVKLFWSDRECAFAAAGIGVAVEFRATEERPVSDVLEDIRKVLRPGHPNLRVYGGLAFDREKPITEKWAPYGAARFFVPAVEVAQKGNGCYLACNVYHSGGNGNGRADDPLQMLDSLQFSPKAPMRDLPPILSRHDRPGRQQWCSSVEDALERFESGALTKAVLARETFFELEEAPDPVVLLRRLKQTTLFSFHFCFQFDHDTAFLGASPERLYKRQNTYLQSEALAGTRPRGTSPEEDAALGKELLASEKDLREHRLVTQAILKVFEEHCRAVRGGKHLELLILRHCQHLLSRIEGMLSAPISDARLLEILHPTPAVGGVPTKEALELIARLEPFNRGWYAAPVGWFGYDAAEFAVAIRSGCVAGNTLSLYSGAGIVAGSDPEKEWAEIENKMQSFMKILDRTAVAPSLV